MFRTLMTSSRFAPLFWCQFFSAFTDNVVKQALIILIAFQIGGAGAGALTQLATAIFILPVFVLAALGGELADRYDKALLARRLKFAEIFGAAIAVAGFALHSLPVLFVAMLFSGSVAALFGPIKYGILPDHLRRHELPAGNALVEGATFLAILFGTILGGLLAAAHMPQWLLFATVMASAVFSWITSRSIPATGEGAPNLHIDRNIARSTARLLKFVWADPRIRVTSLMVSWFWVVGAIVVSLLATLISQNAGGNESVVTIYLAVFSIGIAIGSVLASWLASGRIILLPTPVAAILMGLFLLDAGYTTLGMSASPDALLGLRGFFTQGPGWRLAVDFLGTAIAAGLFIVPAFSAVQAWSEADKRARIVASVNVLSSAFMVVGAAATALLAKLGMTAPGILLVLGIANLVVSIAIFKVLPTNAFRDLLSIIFRAFYRLEVRGAENLLKGGEHTVIALNHVSFLDAALALSLVDKEPVFAINREIADRWWVKPFLRMTRAIPLDPANPMGTRTLIQAVKNGDTLIIFPEGRLTVTGSLMKVYDGAGLIADKTGATIIPVRHEGLEHTAFSRLSREQARRRWWPKVTVTVLEPVTLSVSPEVRGRNRRREAGAALYQIMSDLVFQTTPMDQTLYAAVARAAKRHGASQIAVEDPVSGTLTYKRLLVGATVLGRKLMDCAPVGGAVGVMLPNANGVAATVLGLLSAGRVPAMINFTAGPANILSACKAAEIGTIVTAKTFVEKAKLTKLIEAISPAVRIVYLEDVRATVGFGDKLYALARWKRPLVPRMPNDPAAILFTSGSEGTPKGVVLSHRNILANAAQGAARIDFGRTDKVFNVLPVFHSFGLTVGLFLPLAFGVRAYLYPSPLHYRLVPELVYTSNATILFGTDTFLAGYARHADPYDFRSLRYVLAGAEPVKAATRQTYMEKFGLRILEGYGVTEAAPALALNTPMFNRTGTVGRILPGMEVRLEPVPGIEDGGRLFIRGPNIMLGYLRAENPGKLEPPVEGWHDTGDIVTIDREGFVTIKGRAKRFAKIAGEMISLAAVENLAARLWPDYLSAVTAVPDQRKGERLILMTEKPEAARDALLAFARREGATELMVPATVLFVKHLPLLGSGKTDYVAIAAQAAEQSVQAAVPSDEPAVDSAAADEPLPAIAKAS